TSANDVPYAPWRRVLLQLYPGLEASSENDCREFLIRKHPHWGIRAGLLREILQPGSALDSYTIEQKRAAVAALVTDLLVEYGFPVVILLENVQHLDQSSRFVLASLLSYLSLQETQIFLWLTAHTKDQLPAQVQLLQLSMMNQEAVTQLRQQLLGDGSPELDAFLLEKTGGNPLHLRLLMGHIQEKNTQWTALEKTDLRGLIKHVLQTMDERTRYMLYCAAAIPGEFTEAHLSAVDPELRPDSALFLSRRDDGRWVFLSSICQEAVAALTPETERQLIHQRLAAYLEQQHPTYSARIAYHYQHSDQPQIARNYLVQAAHTSHACGAYEEALTYITRALELPGDLSTMEKFVLLTEQADLFYALQDYPRQAAALQKLSEIAREMDDAWLYSESGWRWLNHYRMTRQFAEGIATWKLFYEQAEKAFNTVAKAEISIATALLHQEIGQYDESQNQLDEAVKLAGQTRKMSLGARILFTLGNVFEAAASYDLAQACFEQALEIYNQENNEVGIANCMTALGSMYHDIGHAQVAHNFLEKAYEFWMAVGNFAEAVQCNLILTDIALQQGRAVAAIENAVRVQFVVNQLGNTTLLGRWWLAYGQACQAVGSTAQAVGCFTQVINYIPQQDTPEWVEAAVSLAYAHAQNAESQQWLGRVLEVDPDLKNHSYSPQCYLNLAAVLPDKSYQILQTGRQVIQQKAEKIADEKVKKHYLARPDRQNLFNVVAVN
ncbi:MAG: tetratricopeptide repeat protein, partial [Anaerolineae bacterium]|nr:tetratricopeptide repeat protein [Anaerolineae bacterium]